MIIDVVALFRLSREQFFFVAISKVPYVLVSPFIAGHVLKPNSVGSCESSSNINLWLAGFQSTCNYTIV